MKKKKTSFFKFLFPFVCIFIIPILLWFFSNVFVINNNNEKVLKVMSDSFEKHINIVENDLKQVESFAYSIGMNSELNKFFDSTEDRIPYQDMKKIQKTIGTYDISDMPVINVYLYNKSNNVLIDRDTSYRNSEEYYKTKNLPCFGNAEKTVNELRSGNWKNGFGKTEKYIYDGEEKNIINYIRTVPFTKWNINNANITVLINADEIISTLMGFVDGSDYKLFVLNRDGNIVIEDGTEKISEKAGESIFSENDWAFYEQDGKKYCKFIYKSPKTDWSYVVYIQKSYLFADTHAIGITLNALTFLSLIFAIIISAYFAFGRRKAYTSIRDVLGVPDEKDKCLLSPMNEFSTFKPYIENVLEEKEKAYDELNKIKKYDDERVLYLLFSGYFNDEAEAEKVIEESCLNIKGKNYIVMTVETQESISFEDSFEENLQTYLREQLYVFKNNPGQMAVLFSFDESPQQFAVWLKDRLEYHANEIFQYISVFIGIGDEKQQLSAIAKSYDESKQVVLYNKIVGTDYTFFNELPEENIDFYYPHTVENSLINAILCSDLKSAKSILQQIYRENFIVRKLTLSKINELIFEINSSFSKIKKEQKISKKYDFKEFTVSSFFTYAETLIEDLCIEASSNMEEKAKHLFDEMVMYVKENYSNPDLSLVDVSERFGISVTYVSKLFKRKTGINFYVFLESLRIDKACEMLKEGKVPIKDITTQVGYLNDATFRRAFKRKNGVSPSNYMRMNENKRNL